MTKRINKGILIIESEEDKKIIARYLKALAEGNETFQPKGLKKQNSKPQPTNKHNPKSTNFIDKNSLNTNFV